MYYFDKFLYIWEMNSLKMLLVVFWIHNAYEYFLFYTK